MSKDLAFRDFLDFSNYMTLQRIRDQQAAEVSATAALAIAAEEQADAVREQGERAAEHAAVIEGIESARLEVERERLNREKQRQKMKAEIFGIKTAVETLLRSSEFDLLSRFIRLNLLANTLDHMPVSELGEYQDMAFHAELLGKLTDAISQTRALADEQIEVFEQLMLLAKRVASGSLALDAYWRSSRISPLENKLSGLRQKEEELSRL